LLSRKVLNTPSAVSAASTATRPRFVAKGLRPQRKRLGLSATEYGKLLGVSAQSIYNWERELASPRTEQLSKLAALRGIGKRQAAEKLKQLRSAKSLARRKS
jgi:predicted transcriptional regulator